MRNGIQTGEGDSKNSLQVAECEKMRWKGDLALLALTLIVAASESVPSTVGSRSSGAD